MIGSTYKKRKKKSLTNEFIVVNRRKITSMLETI